MRSIVQIAVASVMIMGAVRAEAQLPSVQQVYDSYAKAVGGRDAWKSVQGRSDKGTADITFAGLSGAYEQHTAQPNKMRMIIDLGVVKIDQGFDGEKGWADQGQGVQRLPADQEKEMSEPSPDGANFLNPARFAKATVEAKEVFDGAEAYKLSVTNKSGRESLQYFDAKTGLLIGGVTKTPMGDVQILYKDYKPFEGKLVPTKVVRSTPQGDIVMNIQLVTFGMPDAAYFKAPAELK